ncbi:unnamed protein product [Schistocephalus solidus]|uniref:HOXA10 n=1 Tax=Schistocephalus solidus TaxID=70667 RepID=A0A183TIJ6_SCHSO|nr:unnamed protein product [Schistocephalus solidus]
MFTPFGGGDGNGCGGGDMQPGHSTGLSGDLSQVCASGSVTPEAPPGHSAEPGAFTCNSHLNSAAYLDPNSYLNELKINGGAGRTFPVGPYFPPRAAVVAAALNAGLDSLNCGGGGGGAGSGKTKRGVLPKRATQVMKQWLFQHLVSILCVGLDVGNPTTTLPPPYHPPTTTLPPPYLPPRAEVPVVHAPACRRREALF